MTAREDWVEELTEEESPPEDCERRPRCEARRVADPTVDTAAAVAVVLGAVRRV